jgi:hypothetical protein
MVFKLRQRKLNPPKLCRTTCAYRSLHTDTAYTCISIDTHFHLTNMHIFRKAGVGRCSIGILPRPLPQHVIKQKGPAPDSIAPGASTAVASCCEAAPTGPPKVASKATVSSTSKKHRGMPNQSDVGTGWGPVENLTVAALDYTRLAGGLPKEDGTFTELALWLANNAAALGVQQGNGEPESCNVVPMEDDGKVTLPPETMQRFQLVAQRLLGLNRSSLPSGLQQPPELNSELHHARQLWQSLPQPSNAPAVSSLATASTLSVCCCCCLSLARLPLIGSSCSR